MDTLAFVGLGNPGAKYQHTRHNLGIVVLRQWVEQMQLQNGSTTSWQARRHVERIVWEIPTASAGVIRLHGLFPLTYMNNCGEAIAAYLHEEGLETSSLVVLHDEIELPAGEVKLTLTGSAKGHNGVRSLFQSLGTQDVARLRLGIGRPTEQPVDEYVLGKFSSEEMPLVQEATQKATDLLDQVIQEGLESVVASGT